SEAFMPSVPMAMPSVTEIVLNSIGVPPLARTPSATLWASLRWLELQGVSSIQQWAMPTSGRARSSSVKPTARKYERAAARSGPSSSARLLWRGSNAMILGLQVDRAVDAVADHVHALAVPGIRQPPVGQVRERDAGVRIGPAVGRADAAVAERARGGQRAETADGRRGAARVRTEAAVHGHAHVVVDHVAGEIARDVLDHPRREQAHAVERAAGGHHLVEGGHRPRGGVATAARRTSLAEGRVVLLGALDDPAAVRRRLVHVGGALALDLGHADEELAGQAQRLDDVLADERAVVLLGQRLHQHGRR